MRPPTSPLSRHHHLDGAQRARRPALGVSFLISAPRGRARSSSCSGPRARGAPPPGRPVRPPPSPAARACASRAPFGLWAFPPGLPQFCVRPLLAVYSAFAPQLRGGFRLCAFGPLLARRRIAAGPSLPPVHSRPSRRPAVWRRPHQPTLAHSRLSGPRRRKRRAPRMRDPLFPVSHLTPGVLPSPQHVTRCSTRSCPRARHGTPVPCRSAPPCAQPRIGLPRSKAGGPSQCCATSTRTYASVSLPTSMTMADGFASPTRVKPSDVRKKNSSRQSRNLPPPGTTPRRCKAHTASGLNWTGLAWGACA